MYPFQFARLLAEFLDHGTDTQPWHVIGPLRGNEQVSRFLVVTDVGSWEDYAGHVHTAAGEHFVISVEPL